MFIQAQRRYMEENENQAPEGEVEVEGQAPEVEGKPEADVAPETQPDPEGKAKESAPAPDKPVQYEINDKVKEFYEKKKWNLDDGLNPLVDGYSQLENKLGNWQQTERDATAWRNAQEQIAQMEAKKQLETGNINSLTTDQLAQLYRSGRVSIAELPANRQYEVQKYVQEQDANFNNVIETQAKDLAEKHPIIKDQKWTAIIADQIEKGVKDPKTGRELTPEEIITQFEQNIQEAERRGEERLKENTQKLKEGNLESTGSAASTKAKPVIKSIKDAYDAARREQEGI